MPTPAAPAVSVVIPCYAQAEYLRFAVESVLLQRYQDWELVIVDDGSPDDTAEVAARLIEAQPGRAMRLIRQQNAGLAAARNAGIAAARGGYILPLDSDDALDADYLARTVAILEGNPEVSIVCTNAALFGAEQGIWVTEPELPLPQLLAFNRFNYCSLYRREVWEAVGGYQPAMTVGYEDWDFWIGAKEHGFRALHLPEPLFFYRTKAESMLTKAKAWDRPLRAQILLNHPGLFDPASLAEARRILAERPLPPPKPTAARAKPPGRVPPPLAAGPRGPTGPVAQPRPHRAPRKADGPLQILHTTEFYWPHVGGSETVVQQISERLARRGHQVTVATGYDPDRLSTELNGVRIEPFKVSGSLPAGLEGQDLGRYSDFVRNWRGDVVMSYGSTSWASDAAYPAVLSNQVGPVRVLAPVGFGPLGDDLRSCAKGYGNYFAQLLPMVLPRFDAVLYHSTGYKDHRLGTALRLTNGVAIPNGVPPEEFDVPPALDFRRAHGIATPYLALCVANFYPAKGHRRLIEALRRLARPDLTTVLVGRPGAALGPTREAIRDLPNVRILDAATREETLAAYQAADLFTFASELECFPLVILEAMASRTPFVSTDCGNVRQLPGGVVCAPDALHQEIGRLLDDEPRRRRLAEEGYSAWRRQYTWDVVVDQYEELYRALLRCERPACAV